MKPEDEHDGSSFQNDEQTAVEHDEETEESAVVDETPVSPEIPLKGKLVKMTKRKNFTDSK